MILYRATVGRMITEVFLFSSSIGSAFNVSFCFDALLQLAREVAGRVIPLASLSALPPVPLAHILAGVDIDEGDYASLHKKDAGEGAKRYGNSGSTGDSDGDGRVGTGVGGVGNRVRRCRIGTIKGGTLNAARYTSLQERVDECEFAVFRYFHILLLLEGNISNSDAAALHPCAVIRFGNIA